MPLIDLLPATLQGNDKPQETAAFMRVLEKFCEEYALGNTIEDSLILKRLQTLFHSTPAPSSVSACTQILKLYDGYFSLLLANQNMSQIRQVHTLILLNNTEATTFEPYIAIEENDENSIIIYQSGDITLENLRTKNLYYMDDGTLLQLQIIEVHEENGDLFYQRYHINGVIKTYIKQPAENDINFTLLNGYIRLTRTIFQNREKFLNDDITKEALGNLIFLEGQSVDNLMQKLSDIPHDIRDKLVELFDAQFMAKFRSELELCYNESVSSSFLLGRMPSSESAREASISEMLLSIINSFYIKIEETLSYDELVRFAKAFKSLRVELPDALLQRKITTHKQILKGKLLELFTGQPSGIAFFVKIEGLFDEVYAENSEQLEADENNVNKILLEAFFEKTKIRLSYEEVLLFQDIFQALNIQVPEGISSLENSKFREKQRQALKGDLAHETQLGSALFEKFETQFNEIYASVSRNETTPALIIFLLTKLYSEVKNQLSYDELLKFEKAFIQLNAVPEDFLTVRKNLFARVLSANSNNLQVAKVQYVEASGVDSEQEENNAEVKLKEVKKTLIDEYAKPNLTLAEDGTYTNSFRSAEIGRVTAVNEILALINQLGDSASKKLQDLQRLLENDSFKKNIGEQGSSFREKITRSGPAFFKVPHVSRKSLATVISEIKANLNRPLLDTDTDTDTVLVKNACSDSQKYQDLMLDEAKYNALTAEHKATLFLTNPKLFAFFVINYYGHKTFLDFEVSPFNKQITIDREKLGLLSSTPDNTSVRDMKNKLLFSLGFEQDLPEERVYLGYLSDEERYQLVEADIPVGEHYLFSKYRDMFLNKFSQEDMDALLEEDRIASKTNDASKAIFYLLPTNICPRLETDAFEAYNKNMFAENITGVVTSSQKSVIVCGVINVGGDHYIPYFANYNKQTKTINLVTVDPYSQLYPKTDEETEETKVHDTKDATFKRLKNLFSKMFLCENLTFIFEDLWIDQQLNGYDCGFHSLDTLETAISTFQKENAFISFKDEKMTFDITQLRVNGKPSKGFDYQAGRYYYGLNFLEESKEPRVRWSKRFKQKNTSIFYGKKTKGPLNLESEFSLVPAEYSYERNLSNQQYTDKFSDAKSTVLAKFMENDSDFSKITEHYKSKLSIIGELEKLPSYAQMLDTLKNKKIEDDITAKDELYKIIHGYCIQEILKEVISSSFEKTIDSLLQQNEFSQKIDYVEKFLDGFPRAKNELKQLKENDKNAIKNQLKKEVEKRIAKKLYDTIYKAKLPLPGDQGTLSFLAKFFNEGQGESKKYVFHMPTEHQNHELQTLLMNGALRLIDANIALKIEAFLTKNPSHIMNLSDENTLRKAMAQEDNIFGHSFIISRFSKNYKSAFKRKEDALYTELDLNIIRKFSSLIDFSFIGGNDLEGFVALFSELAKKGFSQFEGFIAGNPPLLTFRGDYFVKSRGKEINLFFAGRKTSVNNAINFANSISNILSLLGKDASLSAEIKNEMLRLNFSLVEYKEIFPFDLSDKKTIDVLDAQMRSASVYMFNRTIGLIDLLNKAASASFVDKNTKLKYKVITLHLLGQPFNAQLITAILNNSTQNIDQYISPKLDSLRREKGKYLSDANFNNSFFEKPIYEYGQSLLSLKLKGQYFVYCLLNNKTELLVFFGEMQEALTKEKVDKLRQDLLKLQQSSADDFVRGVAWELYNSAPFTDNKLKDNICLDDDRVLTLERLEDLITQQNLRPVESTEEKSATVLHLRKMPDSINFVVTNIKKRHSGAQNFALDYSDLKELESFVAKRQSLVKNDVATGWEVLRSRIAEELAQYNPPSPASTNSSQSSTTPGSKKNGPH